MKSVLLVGLGRFGRYTAQTLNELGHDVLAIDTDETRVNDALLRAEEIRKAYVENLFCSTIGNGGWEGCRRICRNWLSWSFRSNFLPDG